MYCAAQMHQYKIIFFIKKPVAEYQYWNATWLFWCFKSIIQVSESEACVKGLLAPYLFWLSHKAYQSSRHNEGRVSGTCPSLDVLKALCCQKPLASCSGLIGAGIVRTGLVFRHGATYTFLITIATVGFFPLSSSLRVVASKMLNRVELLRERMNGAVMAFLCEKRVPLFRKTMQTFLKQHNYEWILAISRVWHEELITKGIVKGFIPPALCLLMSLQLHEKSLASVDMVSTVSPGPSISNIIHQD